jgi:hypothetical protein
MVIKQRKIRWMAYMGDMRNAYKILVGKPAGECIIQKTLAEMGV